MTPSHHILKNLQNHPHWKEAEAIFNQLVEQGYYACWVGGCVRDAILGRKAKDLDIATDAHPDEVVRLFPNSLEIGKKFGVVMIPLATGGQVEVARFRSDGESLDGRRPQNVIYSLPKEDALRRDFTINALFFDGNTVIDFVGGQKDLQQGLIRCVGDPEKRFLEDHLRMLRAIRFSLELDFSIEPQTFQAIVLWGEKIKHISIERVVVELEKMMRSPCNYEGLNMIKKTGLGHHIFDKVGTLLEEETFEKIKFIMAQYSEKSLQIVLAYMLLFYSENTTLFDKRKYLTRFKLSKSMIKSVLDYISAYHTLTQVEDEFKAFQTLSQEKGAQFLEFSQLFLRINNKSDDILLKYQSDYQRCLVNGKLPQPLLRGDDLLRLGWSGPRIGEVLEFIYREQIKRSISSREELLKIIRNMSPKG